MSTASSPATPKVIGKRFPPRPSGDAEAGTYYDTIVHFMNNKKKTLTISGLRSSQRRKVHELAEKFQLLHKSIKKSTGPKDVLLTKATEAEFKAQQKHVSKPKKSPASKKQAQKKTVSYPRVPRPTNDADAEKYFDELITFLNDTAATEKIFSGCDGLQRKKIHELADAFMLQHHSARTALGKVVTVKKVTPDEFKKQKKKEAMFRDIVKSFRSVAQQSQEAFISGTHGIPSVLDRTQLRTHIRYCSWNIEWMDYFFKDDTTFHAENKASGITDVNALCKNIGNAILEINPDALAILEGPGSIARMNLFQKTYLNDLYECFGGEDGGSQRIYILVKKGCDLKNPHVFVPGNDYLSKPWHFDVTGTFELQEYNFIRRPVIVEAEFEAHGETLPIYFVAVHAKSKYINRGEKMWKGSSAEKDQFIKKAICNRRKIAGECGRLRKCLEETVYSKHPSPMVVVSGDMNDGPGMDFFEEYYLLFDSVDVLMGNSFHRNTMLHPVLNQKHFVAPEDQYSCVFTDYVDNIKEKKVMLDHIFISDVLLKATIQATFPHLLWEKYATGVDGYRPRQEYLSDHRPCFADFAIIDSLAEYDSTHPTTE